MFEILTIIGAIWLWTYVVSDARTRARWSLIWTFCWLCALWCASAAVGMAMVLLVYR